MSLPTQCPHCGAPRIVRDDVLVYWCGTVDKGTKFSRSLMCKDTMVLPRLLARAEKAEAEVERLREKLKQAIEVAHRYDEGWPDASDQFYTFLDNLDKFNTDKK